MKSIIFFIVLPAAAVAFGSISADPLQRPPRSTPARNKQSNNNGSGGNTNTNPLTGIPKAAISTTDAASPWRVALDIGREPLARMPFDWARSGCRMPLVIPTDFGTSSSSNNNNNNGKNDNTLNPHSDTVSFTGPEGAVVRPVTGEKWELSDDERTIALSYTMPERMERRDVYIDAGTELVLTTRVYTQDEMDEINAEYYEAREKLWKAGGEIGDIYDRQEASKKWDEESGQWVRRYEKENPLRVAQKQLFYWGAKANQGRKMAKRPDLNELSDRGSFPGVERGVYFAKGGTVRAGQNGPVCGTWSAMPITNAPVSYRS